MKFNKKLILFIKNVLPPFFIFLYNKYITKNSIIFKGPFTSWKMAVDLSSGYESEVVLNRVFNSALLVKNKQFAFERDSILFEKKQYNLNLIATIFNISIKNNLKKINIIDFGGSLGSTYFQNLDLLLNIEFKWNIVEQEYLVKNGKNYFENENLFFFESLNSLPKECYNLIIISSSLQYIEKFEDVLNSIIHLNIENVFLDRTVVSDSLINKIYIQENPKNINFSSYPTHIFSEKFLLNFFNKQNYALIYDFNSIDFPELKSVNALNKGYFFKKLK